MLLTADQRRENIIALIKKEGKVRVSELSKLYNISEVTIRTDLEHLESTGSITRIHGGAIARDKLYIDMDVVERLNTNAASKKAIASRLADFINDDDTLIINSGTTLTYVLRNLKSKKNITILTNSISNATEAASYYGFNVTLLGGTLETKYGFTYGPDAIAQLEKYHATKCIISVDGITTDNGLSLYYSSEADLVRKMIERADRTIVVADSSKIGKNTFAQIAPLSSVDMIITSESENRSEINNIKKAGVSVYEA